MSEHTQHTSVKGYLLVFAGLMVLTGLTVFLSYSGIPHGKAVLLAGLIALTKCILIATFFMHLKFEGKGILALLLGALFFVAVLIFALLPDIGVIH